MPHPTLEKFLEAYRLQVDFINQHEDDPCRASYLILSLYKLIGKLSEREQRLAGMVLEKASTEIGGP